MSIRVRVALLACLLAWQPGAAVATPALVFDPKSDLVHYAEDPDVLWHPASLTKMMTAYLVFEALQEGKLNMQSKLVCSQAAHAQAPSKIGLPVGGEMELETGLKALLVKSANDVAVMLAEAVSGSELAFVERMNQAAQRLGMTRTVFHNPNGLPHDGQVTTARDLALLSRAIIRDYPQYGYLFTVDELTFGKSRMRNHNSLLRTFEGTDGLKTGYICASGYNVVASATREGNRLVAVVLGGASGRERNDRAAMLLDHGFRRFDWKTMFANSLDALPQQAALADTPVNLRDDICRARPVAKKPAAQKPAAAARAQKKPPAIKDLPQKKSFGN